MITKAPGVSQHRTLLPMVIKIMITDQKHRRATQDTISTRLKREKQNNAIGNGLKRVRKEPSIETRQGESEEANQDVGESPFGERSVN